MKYTLAQIETFYWVAKLGSFQKAAHHLNFSQPTVSLQIRDLEWALRVDLFIRNGRNVQLTDYGRSLFEHAQSLLAEAQMIQDWIAKREAVQGHLRIGMPETFATACLAKLYEDVNLQYPELRIELIIATSPRLKAYLEDREIDLAFLTDAEPESGLKSIMIGKHDMVWVAHGKYGLEEPITPEKIFRMTIFSNPDPSTQFKKIMNWFGTSGHEPTDLCLCDNVRVIAQLAKVGAGITLLPSSLFREEVQDGTIKTFGAIPTIPDSLLQGCYRASEQNQNIIAILNKVKNIIDDNVVDLNL